MAADATRSSRSLRVVSMNLCLSGKGGNLLIQAPLLASAVLTALTASVSAWLSLRAPWFTLPLPLALAWISAPNIAQLYGCLLWLTPWRRRLCEQYKGERVSEWLKQIQTLSPLPDVICIQEVTNLWFDKSYTTLILEKARALGYTHSALPPSAPLLPATLANSGLILLSQHPLLASSYHLFRAQAWFDLFAVNRGCLHAAVDVPIWGRFDVYTAHLAPNPEAVTNLLNIDNGKWKIMTVENNTALFQAKELFQFMNSTAIARDKVVLVGDFNFRAPSATYYGFSSLLNTTLPWGFKDAFVEREGEGERWEPTFGTVTAAGESNDNLLTQAADRCRPKTIDFCWLSLPSSLAVTRRCVLPFSVTNQPFSAISDHCALSVEIGGSLHL